MLKTTNKNDSMYSTLCGRCAEYDCICGTPDFEGFVEEELAEQRAIEDAGF